MKQLEELAKQNFNIPYEVIGEILDNKDPKDRGRLKCKIRGVTELATIYPWCEIKGDFFGADKDTIGVSSVPKIGSLVYISFLYHNPSFPVIQGYVRGNKDSSLLHTVKELDTTIFQTRTDNLIDKELAPLNDASVYPFNNVIETTTAVIEIDDTEANERISIQHKNGTYMEIRPDGTMLVKTKGNLIQCVDGNLSQEVTGNVDIDVVGNIVENVTGNVTQDIDGDVTQTIGGNVLVNVTGTYTVNSGGNMKFTAPRIDLN